MNRVPALAVPPPPGIPSPLPSVSMPSSPRIQLSPVQARDQALAHWGLLRRLASRPFPVDDASADEALDFLLEHLARDDWKQVRKWDGRGSFEGFLRRTTQRLLADFQRHRRGHLRPPKGVDALRERAHRFLVLMGLSRDEARERLRGERPLTDSSAIEAALRDIAVRCRRQIAPPAPVMADPAPSPESLASAAERESLAEGLLAYIEGGCPRIEAGPLRKVLEDLGLDPEERLFLRLHYVEGLPLRKAAARLHLQGDPYKRRDRILGRLRRALAAHAPDFAGDLP